MEDKKTLNYKLTDKLFTSEMFEIDDDYSS